MPNIFDNTSVEQPKAPVDTGAASVQQAFKYAPSVQTKYQLDISAQQEFMFEHLNGQEIFTGKEKDFESLAKCGAVPNRYMTQSDLERLRAKNQSAWKQTGNSLGQTIGTVIGDTIGGIGMLVDIATAGVLDDQPFSNFITRAGDSISNYVRDELFPIYRENPEKAFDFDDPSGWFFSQVPSIASSLSLMIPGIALAKGAGVVGKGISALGKTSSKFARALNKAKQVTGLDNVYRANKLRILAKDGITAIGMRLGENYQEARGVAEQLNEEALGVFNGMSDSEFQNWLNSNPDLANESETKSREDMARVIADNSAMRNFWYNAGNVFFDYIQLRAVNKAFGQINRAITPRLRYAQNQILDRVSSTGVESASQTIGQVVKSGIKGFAGKINRFINSSENLLLSELSEGVEEAVNYVGQEEGTLYGRYLLGQTDQYDGAVSLDRIKNYLQDPQLYNSALWGVIGGVVFGGTMSAINNRKGGSIDEQMRLAEINGREQAFNQYMKNMDIISRGENPYDVERDGSGNPILYLDNGTVSQDPSVGTTRYTKVSPEEQDELREQTRHKFASNLALNALRNGNYELLYDYINDQRLKKKLIDSGLADEASFDSDTQFLNNVMEQTRNDFVNYSTALRSANIDDALLDVAVSENIVNADEARLLQKRIDRLNKLQSDLENTIPEIGQILDPMAKNRMTMAILEQYRRDAYNAHNSLKNSRNPLDRAQARSYQTLINIIESKVNDLRRGLNPMESLWYDYARSNDNEVLGIAGAKEAKSILDKQISELSESDKVLFDQAGQDFAVNKLAKRLNNVNPEYMTNLGQIVEDEIRRDMANSNIVRTNEDAKKFEEDRKAEMEQAAKNIITGFRSQLFDNIENATVDDLNNLNKLLDGTYTDEERKDPKVSDRVSKWNTIKSSKYWTDKDLQDVKDRIQRRTIALNNQTKNQQQQRQQPVQPTVSPVSSSTGEVSSAAVETAPKEEPKVETPVAPTKEEQQLKEALAKAVEDKGKSLINKDNISDYSFEIVKPFTSINFNTDKPVKVSAINIFIGRFGDVSIDGLNANGQMIADVTLEELNAAIEAGEVVASPIKKQDVQSETPLESSIDDSQRIQEINLIIELYNKIQGNTVNGKTYTSLNDMMVYLQRINPNAINLYNDIKAMMARQQESGKVIQTDEQLKSPADIIKDASDNLSKAIDRNKRDNSDGGYYFMLSGLDSPKVYKRIGELKTGDTVSVELDENGNLIVKSHGIQIGEFPKVYYHNGNPQAINSGWIYTVRNNEVDFINELKNIIGRSDESTMEFVNTLMNLRRLMKVRNNPDVEDVFGNLLNTLQENDNWKRLNTLYGDATTELLDKINHLNNIIFFTKSLYLNNPNFASIVSNSLTNWNNKIVKSYSDILDLGRSIKQTKSKKKRIAISKTSSGSVIFAKDSQGRPVYRRFADVTTPEATNGFRLIKGTDYGVADIKTGNIIETSRIPRNVIGITVRDSEGRLIAVPSRENTMANQYGGETEYTKRFNEGIDRLFHNLLDACLTGNTVLHNQLLNEIDKYIGGQKALYGYRINGKALIPANRSGVVVYFNVEDRNVTFQFPDGTLKRLMAVMPNGFVPTNNHGNFATMMQGIYGNLTRNVIDAAVKNQSKLFRVGENGHLFAKIPNIVQDEWMDTGYFSYEEFVAKDGVLVTDLGMITDSKGNFVSNFNYTGDVFSKSITLSKGIATRTSKASPEASPVKEQEVSQAPTSDPLADKKAPTIGSLTEVARENTSNQDLLAVIDMLDAAGLQLSPTVEIIDESTSNRFASIAPGSNVMTITQRFDKLEPERKVLTLIHEGMHYLLTDERANIEQDFGDLFDRFTKFISSDETLMNNYGQFLMQGKPRNVQIEEFVVEAITNRTLARLLSTIKYDANNQVDSNNIFTKVIDAIINLIGKVNQNIDGTVMSELRHRLSNIGAETNSDVNIDSQLDSVSNEDIEDVDGLPNDIPDIDIDIDFESSIGDNFKQTENFDTFVADLTNKQKSVIQSMYDNGSLSFMCE